MRRTQVAVQPHPVGDALDQSAGTAAAGVPLVAVDQLVGYDARDLLCETGGGVDAIDVGEGEVDFLVIAV